MIQNYLDHIIENNKAQQPNLTKDQEEEMRNSGLEGAIFNVKLDLSHPISYGYTDSNLSIFRNTNIYIKNDSIGYNNPIRYVKSPLVSGYISKENAKSIENSRIKIQLRQI